VRERPQLDAALAECGRGDTLVVVALDRLGRDLSDLVKIVAGLKERARRRWLRQHLRRHWRLGIGARTSAARRSALLLLERGVNLVSKRESIDTSTSVGEMLLGIFGSLAQYEKALIQERTRARLASKKVRGERVGRKPALTPSQVKDARALLADGTRSSSQVAKTLGVSRATLYRHLGTAEAAA
jgi:DNA invertase Pin-like site-specific DNA recombinase